jgi:hypothetical protein
MGLEGIGTLRIADLPQQIANKLRNRSGNGFIPFQAMRPVCLFWAKCLMGEIRAHLRPSGTTLSTLEICAIPNCK